MHPRDSLAVRLVLLLNRLTPNVSAGMIRSKRALETYSQFEHDRAASTARTFGPYFDVLGKDILDVGCGLGGSERYYLEQGARSVTAIDLDKLRLDGGQTYVWNTMTDGTRGKTLFAAVDARRMSFSDSAFDLIVSTDTFEHIFGVEQALRECARVLKPRGYLLISFPPYNAPWSAHLSNWIHFPWCQVLFSEKTLVEAARRIEADTRVSTWMPEAIRLDLEGHDKIPHLNRMGVREFEAIVARVPLRIAHASYQTIGWRAGGLLNKIGRFLARNRWLREYVTSLAVYVLERTGP
jgi:SAM-dependent methyltransferase